MQFQSLSHEQSLSQRSPLADGRYEFSVVSGKETESKNGDPMFELQLAIYKSSGGEITKKVWLLPTHPKMGWLFRHFCNSIGILDKYEAGFVELEDILNAPKNGILSISNKEKDGRIECNVTDYLVASGDGKKDVSPEFKDDDVPF